MQESVIFKEMGETHVSRSTWKITFVENLDTLESTPCRAVVYSISWLRVEVVRIFSYKASATQEGTPLSLPERAGRG